MGLYPIIVILVGIISAANVVIERLPNAKNLIEKIAPYQAIIGLVGLGWSVLNLLSLGKIMSGVGFLGDIMILVAMGSSILCGFLLGYPLIQQFFLEDMSEANREKGENIRKKLVPFHVLAGLGALASGGYLFLVITLKSLFS